MRDKDSDRWPIVAWWDRAACVGWDPEWWADDRVMRPMAVRICHDCPVREPCLREARALGDFGVIRGGVMLVEEDRRGHSVSARRRRAA